MVEHPVSSWNACWWSGHITTFRVDGAVRDGAAFVRTDSGQCAQGAVPEPEDSHLLPAHAKDPALAQGDLIHGTQKMLSVQSPSIGGMWERLPAAMMSVSYGVTLPSLKNTCWVVIMDRSCRPAERLA
ncbi:hypothetical protein ABIB27_002591 [Arthrobacter sp. UYEF21]